MSFFDKLFGKKNKPQTEEPLITEVPQQETEIPQDPDFEDTNPEEVTTTQTPEESQENQEEEQQPSEPSPTPVAEQQNSSSNEDTTTEKNEGGGFFSFLGFGKNKAADQKALEDGLEKSNDGIFNRISKAIAGRTEVDVDVLDAIEEALVASDIAVDTVIKIIKRLEDRIARDKYLNTNEVYSMLKQEIIDMLTESNTPDYTNFNIPDVKPLPYIMLVVGVNGAGKTTTIGKLSWQFKQRGLNVMVGAADTFRAAAVEQLNIWAQRVGIEIIKHPQDTDPAAVAYDAAQAAIARKADVLLIDTAGRLHNKKYLMDELSKIKRVLQKVHPNLPHDVLLVLDGSTGHNALHQAEEFTKATEITCIAVTKLDGTAKGGAVISIADQFKIPIKYVGVGETVDRLQVFNKRNYVESLFKKRQ
ncbi:MAG: signal recognition particle-docking protein FtsY [Sphingobacteriales bacterium]|jgi:fused signal recognition particle receptor|nr:signal recognition particle-docking protein FtsY [Sphingobacteriales bacterium]MBK7528744.1 signal recognition particle-docking protein FtsY [Sphingobacteriales bacterium]MBP9141869.1 signal recognition particle-docking protein FtsY [Chitinophagales bacterium]MCC7057051.1 signal recognition particle-docking protein FtsY [Chitinophagales bacterium]